jgi:hypothetical protein
MEVKMRQVVILLWNCRLHYAERLGLMLESLRSDMAMSMTLQIEFQTLMSHPHTKHSLHLYNQCLFQRIGRLQSWIPGGKKDAMKEELGALQRNKTWDLLPLPAGKRAVGCKWVFTVKQTPEGKVDR